MSKPNAARDAAVHPSQAAAEFENFDRKMITAFEILVAYFVDVVFNHIYRNAGTTMSKGKDGSSLTDVYRDHIQAYMTGVKTDAEGFRDTMSNLHQFFAGYYGPSSYAQFVDTVVGHFVPPEYFGMLKVTDRDEMMSSIVCDLVTQIGVFATTTDLLHRIIDQHQPAHLVTTRMMQNHGIRALLGKRDTIRNQFLKRVGQARETVSMDVIDDMKKVLRKLVKEKAEMKVILQSAFAQVEKQKALIKDYKQREHKFRKLIEHLKVAASGGLAEKIQASRVPRPNTIAEDPLEPDDPIAPEPNTLGEDVDEPRPSRNARHAKPAPVISKSFFKTTPARTPAPRESKRTPLVTPANLRPGARRPQPVEEPEDEPAEEPEQDQETEEAEEQADEADDAVMAAETEVQTQGATLEAPEDDEPLRLLLGGVRRT